MHAAASLQGGKVPDRRPLPPDLTALVHQALDTQRAQERRLITHRRTGVCGQDLIQGNLDGDVGTAHVHERLVPPDSGAIGAHPLPGGRAASEALASV